MDLSELQRRRVPWVARNFGGKDTLVSSILGATEEIGELAHHYLKLSQGIRGEAEMHKEGMLDAVGDAVIYLAGVCSHLGVDYGEVVRQTWLAVEQRDWVADPVKGGT